MESWGFSAKVAVTGFVTVFVVLSILALVLWGTGKAIARALSKKEPKEGG